MQKQDSVAVINCLRMTPISKSHLLIPLCRMRIFPLVRPVIEGDVQRLENKFVNGYREGDRMLYVSPYNNFDRFLDISNAIKDSWRNLWKVSNEGFEERLAQDKDLPPPSGKMFFMYKGNHRLTAWMRHINKYHGSDTDWYVSVDCILLDAHGQNGVLLNAMYDINE